ncbi:hypothetical protein BDV28DRAFT_145486 [Aspergillus coremiiformis]|uniref:Uncharacterized protein n=1 Tax=Aspergillus coremiiformis TaxID=138285 RepID=A0A5N6ZFZ0_9EURO|nr:hypothetical protein BDV28DRAFT_145486 [Aspergillus coremiiformis]
MHLPTLVSLAYVFASTSAFQYPDFVPLHRRQDPGTPAYECHANCGGVITAARKDGYCDTDTFTTQLSDCLDCAHKYNIWKYYGSPVSKAATACGLDATPAAVSSATPTAVVSTSATESGTPVTVSPSSTATDIAGATSASSTSVPSSSSVVSSTPATSTIVSSPTPSPNSTSPTVSLFTGAASTNSRGGLLLSVIAGSLAVLYW